MHDGEREREREKTERARRIRRKIKQVLECVFLHVGGWGLGMPLIAPRFLHHNRNNYGNPVSSNTHRDRG